MLASDLLTAETSVVRLLDAQQRGIADTYSHNRRYIELQSGRDSHGR